MTAFTAWSAAMSVKQAPRAFDRIAVKGIQLFGTIDRDLGDRVDDLVEQVGVWHGYVACGGGGSRRRGHDMSSLHGKA